MSTTGILHEKTIILKLDKKKIIYGRWVKINGLVIEAKWERLVLCTENNFTQNLLKSVKNC